MHFLFCNVILLPYDYDNNYGTNIFIINIKQIRTKRSNVIHKQHQCCVWNSSTTTELSICMSYLWFYSTDRWCHRKYFQYYHLLSPMEITKIMQVHFLCLFDLFLISMCYLLDLSLEFLVQAFHLILLWWIELGAKHVQVFSILILKAHTLYFTYNRLMPSFVLHHLLLYDERVIF